MNNKAINKRLPVIAFCLLGVIWGSNFYIVDTLGAVAAASVTYIPPVIALMIGALLVGEPVALADYGATFLIFIGVFLLRRK